MLYSRTKLAESLFETLEEMKVQNLINPQTKSKITNLYQSSIADELQKRLKSGRIEIKGFLNSYQFVDNVWHFFVQGANLEGEIQDFSMKMDMVQIISMDLKCLTPEEKAEGNRKKGKMKGGRKRKSNETETLEKFID